MKHDALRARCMGAAQCREKHCLSLKVQPCHWQSPPQADAVQIGHQSAVMLQGSHKHFNISLGILPAQINLNIAYSLTKCAGTSELVSLETVLYISLMTELMCSETQGQHFWVDSKQLIIKGWLILHVGFALGKVKKPILKCLCLRCCWGSSAVAIGPF